MQLREKENWKLDQTLASSIRAPLFLAFLSSRDPTRISQRRLAAVRIRSKIDHRCFPNRRQTPDPRSSNERFRSSISIRPAIGQWSFVRVSLLIKPAPPPSFGVKEKAASRLHKAPKLTGGGRASHKTEHSSRATRRSGKSKRRTSRTPRWERQRSGSPSKQITRWAASFQAAPTAQVSN